MTPPLAQDILHPRIFGAHPCVTAAVSTRNGGVSGAHLGMNLSFSVGDTEENVRENREIFFGTLGIGLDELAIPQQVHGGRVMYAERAGRYTECDALITRTPRVFLVVTIADCVPLLLYDPLRRAVAAIHAGWRGTVARIVERVVGEMRSGFGTEPADLLAYVGPSAGCCCYAVGKEVASQFEEQFVSTLNRSLSVDLKAASVDQLRRAGVTDGRIEVSHHCTIMESNLFHSHRRDGQKSGRMMAVIGFSTTNEQ